EAEQYTPYSAEYLSLLARKGRLGAKKIDGVWFTTRAILNDYLSQQLERAEVLNKNPDTYRPFVVASNEGSVDSVAAPIPPQAEETVVENAVLPQTETVNTETVA